MKLDATAFFQCAKDGVKSVKQYTRTWCFAENICFYAGNKTRVFGMWITLRAYRHYVFIQEYNLLFPIQKMDEFLKKNIICCFKTNFFSGQFFKFDGYN